MTNQTSNLRVYSRKTQLTKIISKKPKKNNKKNKNKLRATTKVWKTRKFDDLLIRFRKAVYNQNTTGIDKRLHPSFK